MLIRNDRDALLYLMEQFDITSHECERCGDSDPEKDCDSAIWLRGYLNDNPAVASDERRKAEKAALDAAMKAWRAAEARGNSSVRDPDRPRLQVEQWAAVSALHAACAALAKLQTA